MKRVLALLLCLLAASPSWGAVAYVTAVTATETGQDTSISLSIDVGAGSDRLLVCGVHGDGAAETVSGVTHNAVPLTQSGEGLVTISTIFVDVWYLIAPASGSQTVTATITNTGVNKILTCAAFTGVHQSNPIGTGGVFAAFSDPSTVSLAVPVNGAGVVFNTNAGEADAGTFTVDAASTKRADLADTDGNIAAIVSTKTTAETANVTVSNTNFNYSAMIALPINPATAARPTFAPVVFQ